MTTSGKLKIKSITIIGHIAIVNREGRPQRRIPLARFPRFNVNWYAMFPCHLIPHETKAGIAYLEPRARIKPKRTRLHAGGQEHGYLRLRRAQSGY